MSWKEWNNRSAYVLIRGDSAAVETTWKACRRWKETIGASMVSGSWDLLVWLDVSTMDDLYKRVAWIRGRKGVESTSSHFVFKGMKNSKDWWEWPAGSWVFLRAPRLDADVEKLARRSWASSVASLPGDWDYLMWAGGKSWEKVWSNIRTLNQSGWKTETAVPLKSWWNRRNKQAWAA
jgi:hypothetical protein